MALWEEIARRYKDNRTVAGYDILNEPQASSKQALRDFYTRTIRAIRAIDRQHMIWLEGDQLSSDLTVFDRSFGENVGYSTHVYTFPFDRRRQRYADASAVARRLNAPMWIGEFGISDRTLPETVGMIERAPGVVGWSYWSWKYVAKDAAPCDLTPPRAWTDVAGWVSGAVFARKPRPEAVAAGTRAFVDYLRAYRCVPDAAVMRALAVRG